MKRILLVISLLSLLLTGCGTDGKKEETKLPVSLDITLEEEAKTLLLNQDIVHITQVEGFVFVVYSIDGNYNVSLINPEGQLGFTLDLGDMELDYVTKLDEYFVLHYNDQSIAVYSNVGELQFTANDIFYMHDALDYDYYRRSGVVHIGDGTFAYLQVVDDSQIDTQFQIVYESKDSKEVLYDFNSTIFNLGVGYFKDHGFMIYTYTGIDDSHITSIDLQGNVIYQRPVLVGTPVFYKDYIIFVSNSFTKTFSIFDLDFNLITSFTRDDYIIKVEQVDENLVIEYRYSTCTIKPNGFYECLNEGIPNGETLQEYEDGSILRRHLNLNKTEIVLYKDSESMTLLSEEHIDAVYVQDDSIFVTKSRYGNFYIEVIDLDGNIVIDELKIDGPVIAVLENGNYIIDACEPDPTYVGFDNPDNCYQEINNQGQVIWESEQVFNHTTITVYEDIYLVLDTRSECVYYYNGMYECHISLLNKDGQTIYSPSQEYFSVRYLFQTDEHIYLLTNRSNTYNNEQPYNRDDFDGEILVLDKEGNIVDELEVLVISGYQVYYLQEDNLVQFNIRD